MHLSMTDNNFGGKRTFQYIHRKGNDVMRLTRPSQCGGGCVSLYCCIYVCTLECMIQAYSIWDSQCKQSRTL